MAPCPSGNRRDIENVVIDRSYLHVANSINVSRVPSDLWSSAYREAVGKLGKDVDVSILNGESVAELFMQLEELDKDNVQESAFLRGGEILTLASSSPRAVQAGAGSRESSNEH